MKTNEKLIKIELLSSEIDSLAPEFERIEQELSEINADSERNLIETTYMQLKRQIEDKITEINKLSEGLGRISNLPHILSLLMNENKMSIIELSTVSKCNIDDLTLFMTSKKISDTELTKLCNYFKLNKNRYLRYIK